MVKHGSTWIASEIVPYGALITGVISELTGVGPQIRQGINDAANAWVESQREDERSQMKAPAPKAQQRTER